MKSQTLTIRPKKKIYKTEIIALATFWCKTLNNGSLLNLSLIMPLDTNDLPSQDLIIIGQQETVQEGDSEIEVEHPMLTQEDLTHMLGLEFLND